MNENRKPQPLEQDGYKLNRALLQKESSSKIRQLLLEGATFNEDTLNCAIASEYPTALLEDLFAKGARPDHQSLGLAQAYETNETICALILSYNADVKSEMSVDQMMIFINSMMKKYNARFFVPAWNEDEFDYVYLINYAKHLLNYGDQSNDEFMWNIAKRMIDNVLHIDLNADNLELFNVLLELSIARQNLEIFSRLIKIINPTRSILNRALFSGCESQFIIQLLMSGAKPNAESLNCALFGGHPLDVIVTVIQFGAAPNDDTRCLVEYAYLPIQFREQIKNGPITNRNMTPVKSLNYCLQEMRDYITKYGFPRGLMKIVDAHQPATPPSHTVATSATSATSSTSATATTASCSRETTDPLSAASSKVLAESRFIKIGVPIGLIRFVLTKMQADNKLLEDLYSAWLDVANLQLLLPDEILAQWISVTENYDWDGIGKFLDKKVECAIEDFWTVAAMQLRTALERCSVLPKKPQPQNVKALLTQLINDPRGLNAKQLEAELFVAWSKKEESDPETLSLLLELSLIQEKFALFCEIIAKKIVPTTETLNRALFIGAAPCFIFKLLKERVQPNGHSINCALFGVHPHPIINLLLQQGAKPNDDTAQYIEYSSLQNASRILIKGSDLINPDVSHQDALHFCWNNLMHFQKKYGVPYGLIQAASLQKNPYESFDLAEVAKVVEKYEVQARENPGHTDRIRSNNNDDDDSEIVEINSPTKPTRENDDDDDNDRDDKRAMRSKV